MEKLTPVTSSDYADLSAFLADFQDETRDRQYWLDRFNLWWDANPAFSGGMDRGWVIKKDGKILGFFGTIPSRFRLLGNEITISNATSWRVLPEYRSSSLQLFSSFLNTSENSILFSTTPNIVVRKILRAAGFQLIPRKDRSATTLIINLEKVIGRSFLSSRANRLYHRMITGGKGPHEVKEIAKADSSFDRLWEKTKNAYPSTNVRTSKIINWYCAGSRYHRKKIFGCFDGGRLRGYAIFWDYGHPKRRTLECLDLWAEPNSRGVVESLIRAAIKYACRHSFDFMSFPHFNKGVRDALKKLVLKKTSQMKEKDYFKVNAPSSDKITEENSYFVRAQGDIGL